MAESLKVTVEQLAELGQIDQAHFLEESLKERERYKKMEEEAKAGIERVNKEIIPVMLALDLSQVTDPNLGSLIYKEGVNRSISKERLINSLLAHGMGAEEIATVVEEVTKETPYETVEYRRVRKNG